MNDNYTLDILGTLDQNKSKKEINVCIRQLERTINMLRLTGTFAKGDTKRELNTYIKSLQSKLNYVKLSAKVDSKNVKKDIDNALHGMKFKDIDALNVDESKAKLKVRKVIADVKTYAEKTPITVNIEYKKNKLNNDLITYLNKNTKINESSILLNESEKVRELIDAIDDKKSLAEATDAFRLFKSEVSATGYSSKSTTDKIKSMIGHITKVGSVFGVASMAVNNFIKSLQTLRSNDTILTEISKTSEMTKNQLKEFGDEAFKVASKYGQLSSNFLLATQEMARAGYDDNVKAMAELSTKAQGAGDTTAELANKYIIATDKAFKMNGVIETLTATLDGANNITNNNALTMSDLGEAMSIVGSQAASSGMAVNETTSAVATMIATTQRSGREMANAFKGILMNLRQVSGDVGDGEDIIDTESLTKYEKACAELGVSLSTVKDGIVSLKEPMQIIKELSEAYTRLEESDARRANLLSAVGGKYRANALNAILENYDMYEKMLKEYADGLGSMDEEAEKTANSWQGRLNALQNSWDSLISSLTNKEAVLSGISLLDRLIQGAEKFVDTFGTIPTVLTAINSSMVAMHKDYGITQLVNKDSGKIDLEGSIFGIDFSALKNQKKHFEEAGKVISGWNSKLNQGQTDINKFDDALVKNSAQLKEYLTTCSKDAPASLSGYKSYLNEAGISTDALRLKTILLNSAISMGIGVAIQAAVQGITYLIQREENLRQAAEEAANAYKESASVIDNYASRYQELHKALFEAKGDEEETYNIKKQLLDLQTELNNKYGDEYGRINLLTDAYRDQTEEIKALNKEKAQTFLNENKEGIDKASKEMTKDRHYNLSYTGMSSYTDDGAALKEIAEKCRDKGIWLNEDDSTGTYNLILEADAQSAYDTINAFENDVRAKAKELGDEHIFDDVLEISSSELNRAKEIIDNCGETYKQALTAEIVSDDSKAKTYSEALQAVEAYNEAVLKSENPYDDQNVIQAKENLGTIKSSIQGNEEELGKYSILFDDLFDQADTRLIEFNEAINNDSGLQELAKDLEGLSDLDLQALNENVGENDSFDKLKKAAGEYKLNVEELINALIRLGFIQGEIQSPISNTIPPVQFNPTDFSKYTEALSSLRSTYNDFYEKSKDGISFVFDISDIEKLREEFGETCNSFDEFEALATASGTSTNEMQDAFDKLATEYIFGTNMLNGLNESTREQILTQLELQGIVGANSIITEEFAKALSDASEKGIDFANSTHEEINAFIREGTYIGETQQKLYAYAIQKMLANENCLNATGDIEALQRLCENLGITTESLMWFARAKALQEQIDNGVDSALVVQQLNTAKDKCKELAAQVSVTAGGFANMGKAASDASKSGSKGADRWKEAYNKELKELERMHNKGLISDEEYWKARIDLNEKYFGESSGMHQKYLDEYRDNEEDILEGLKKLWEDYYNERKNNLKDLISYAGKLYDKEIDSYEDSIKVLEEKRDAEKKHWQEQIDALDDEINALQDANDERERAIDLQNKQWALQKAMHQRTVLSYTESGGMVYRADDKAIRDSQNDLDSAENDNKIEDLKKQQKELQKQLDIILETYDSQIESIEKQIDSLKKVKSAWSEIVDNQELKELEERLKSIFGDDVRDKILSGNTDFINSIISQYSSTSDMLRTIEDATLADIQNMVAQYGVLPENLMPIADAAADINNALGTVDTTGFNTNLDNTAQSSSNAAEKVQNVTSALNTLSNDISSYQMPALNTDSFTASLAEDGAILTALRGFTERFRDICDGIPDIWNNSLAEAFGQGGGNGDPLSGGLPNDTKYDALFEPLYKALNNCKTNMEDKLKECLGTFISFQTDLSGIIGVGGGSSEDSGASQYGITGKSGKASGGENKSESGGGSDTIVGAIQEGGSLIDQALNGNEDSWSASFDTAKESIHKSAESIVECIESMVETIVSACSAAIGAINMLASADENHSNNPAPAPYIRIGHAHSDGTAHIEGTAKVMGDWAVQSDENKALVGEIGRELIVRQGKYFTVGDNGAEMFDIKKGDIVFNHEQTEALLKNGYISGRGKAYADGTVGGGKFLTPDGHILRPIRPGDRAWDLQKAFEPLLQKWLSGEQDILNNAVFEGRRQMEKWTKEITNNSAINNITNNRNVQPVVNQEIHVTLPNVTNSTSAESLLKDLQSLATKKMQVNW